MTDGPAADTPGVWRPQQPLLEDTAEDLYDAAPCGYLSTYPDGTFGKVNQTFLTWTGYTREELVGRRRFLDLLAPGSRIYHETHFAPLLRMQGSVQEIALDLVRADGSRIPVLVNSQLRTDDAGQPLLALTTVFDASDRKRYERELLLARRRAEQYAGRLATLQQAVADLAAAAEVADVSRVIVRVAHEAAGAESTAVWLEDSATGAYEWVTSLGAPDPEPAARTLRPEAKYARHEAVRRGDVVSVPVLSDVLREFPVAWVTLEGTDSDALVLAPLVAQGQTLGIVGLRLGGSREPDQDELAVLETLGRQAGLAVQRARLFDEQRNVALTLQRSLLSRDYPRDPRVRIATCYLPAEDAMEVGGDWYDTFALDPDHIAVVVGDVVGRGVHAAAAMGQLRSAVRALAAVEPDPAILLGRLDRFVEGVEAAQMATLTYAQLDLRDGSLRYACAGHPPPVLVDPAGTATTLWGGRSTPLGAHFGTGRRTASELLLQPGSRLLLYTDGLIERRDRGLDVGITRLAEEVASSAGLPLDVQVKGVTEAMLGDAESRDDVCLLGLAYRQDAAFEQRLPAHRAEVAGLRRQLGAWLDERGVDELESRPIVLACSEAVANAIEHGYGDEHDHEVDVMATLHDGILLIRVSDDGRWKPRRASSLRGRGLSIIRRVMDQVTVDRGAGTVVTMQRRIRPATSL